MVSCSAQWSLMPRLEDARWLGCWWGAGWGGGAELAKEGPTLTVTAVPTPRQMETCHVESEEPGAGPVLTMFLQGAEGHSASLCPPYLPTGRGGRNEVGEGGSNILKRNLF